MDSFENCKEDAETILDEMRLMRSYNGEYITPNKRRKHSIILLGRTGVGKTTIAKVINDSLYYRSQTKSHVITKKPIIREIGSLYIVDTPDIFDDQNQPSKCEITEEDVVIDGFTITFNDRIFPLFGLVCSIEQGVNSSDITAILNFKTKFARFSRKMILILTHCEEKTAMQRQELIDEFFDHPRLVEGEVRRFFERGVLFMGCIRRQSLESGNRDALTFEHSQVIEMRAEFIRRCQENKSLASMPSSKTSMNHWSSLLPHFSRTENCGCSLCYKLVLCLCVLAVIVLYIRMKLEEMSRALNDYYD